MKILISVFLMLGVSFRVAAGQNVINDYRISWTKIESAGPTPEAFSLGSTHHIRIELCVGGMQPVQATRQCTSLAESEGMFLRYSLSWRPTERTFLEDTYITREEIFQAIQTLGANVDRYALRLSLVDRDMLFNDVLASELIRIPDVNEEVSLNLRDGFRLRNLSTLEAEFGEISAGISVKNLGR